MTIDEVLKYYDGKRKRAAAALDISYQAIVKWEETGEIPFLRQCHIELITGGELLADEPEAGAPIAPRGNSPQQARL